MSNPRALNYTPNTGDYQVVAGRLGDDASMLAHITLAHPATPNPVRTTNRANDEDGSAIFRDKAVRLARLHFRERSITAS